jgi:hypothetical protein
LAKNIAFNFFFRIRIPNAQVFLGIQQQWDFFFFEKPENSLKLGLENLIQNIENPEWETYKILKIGDCFLGCVWFGLTFVKSIARPLIGASSEGPGTLYPSLAYFLPFCLFHPKIHKWETPKLYQNIGSTEWESLLPLWIPRNTYAFGIHMFFGKAFGVLR